MIWKPGDRAVFCYRPRSELPIKLKPATDPSRYGKTGTVIGFSILSSKGTSYTPFKTDGGDAFEAATLCLAPILEDPFAVIPKGEHIHA
jgi:hypothetical protein